MPGNKVVVIGRWLGNYYAGRTYHFSEAIVIT